MYATLRPRLEVRHLRMLVAIDEAGSVADAADLLGVSASALTHRIREAERRLGVALYSRVKGRLRPTPASDVLRQSAERLLTDLDRSEAVARAYFSGVEHVVRLGIGFYTAYHWLPWFLKRLRAQAPDLDVEIVAGAARRPLDMLGEGGIDLAIVGGEPNQAGISGVRLFNDELVAIMAPEHRLAGRAYVVAEDFIDEDYLSYSRTVMPGHEHDRLFRPAEVHPRRYITVELPEAIVELVAAGFGVSVLAGWAVAPQVRWGAIASSRLTENGLDIDWYAAVRETEGADSPGRRLASALAAWCRETPDAFAIR
ncbi:MAG: LysR family transcriptional regulator [Alphaproteobacteria bacterium]